MMNDGVAVTRHLGEIMFVVRRCGPPDQYGCVQCYDCKGDNYCGRLFNVPVGRGVPDSPIVHQERNMVNE